MVRAIGVSIHGRKRAGKLAEDSPLDMLMIHYNAAHSGATRRMLPLYGSFSFLFAPDPAGKLQPVGQLAFHGALKRCLMHSFAVLFPPRRDESKIQAPLNAVQMRASSM